MMRNCRFDNAKVVLMLMVVIVHTLINSYGHAGMEMIRFCLLCFTMPLFCFISGYLSKTSFDLTHLVKRLLIPLIAFSIFYKFYMLYLTGERINWLTTGFAMWYIMVLFIYRSSLPILVKIPYVLPLSIAVAFAAGLCPLICPSLNLSRIICFLPFFLAGYYVHNGNANWMKKARMLIEARNNSVPMKVAKGDVSRAAYWGG